MAGRGLLVGRRSKRSIAKSSRGFHFHRPLRLETLEDRRLLALVTVTTELDVIDFDDGVTSLREALFATNTVSGPDTINFDFGHDGPATILLTGGELAITDDLSIEGLGANLLTINASGNDPTPDENSGDGSRVFNISIPVAQDQDLVPKSVVITGLTLTGGDTRGDGGAINSIGVSLTIRDTAIVGNTVGEFGGGISAEVSDGAVALQNVIIAENSASGEGGGMFARVYGGTITFEDVTIAENSAGTYGGGLSGILQDVIVTISRSTIRDNTARVGGGASLAWRGRNNELTISNSTISGNSASGNRAHGGGLDLFIPSYSQSSTLVIRGSTIEANTVYGNYDAHGGGIYSRTKLAVIDCTITGNSADGSGGGIYSRAELDVIDSRITGNSASDSGGGISKMDRGMYSTIAGTTIDGNTAGGDGGGVYSRLGGRELRVSIIECTISNNIAGRDGGGLFAGAGRSFDVISSTFHANTAGRNGGGIAINRNRFMLLNSTVSGNHTGVEGGGIRLQTNSYESTTIAHSTITDNRAEVVGGGVFMVQGRLALNHSIVAENSVPLVAVARDLGGLLDTDISATYGIIGSNRGNDFTPAPIGMPDDNGNLIGGRSINDTIDPLLGPLADNGGPTLTHALLLGSPAIDAGDPNARPGVDGVPDHDQRGAPSTRVFGGTIDIGAFESQPTDVLLGDFNRDGVVSSADYIVWRNAMAGDTPASVNPFDGNGDGSVDEWDYRLWRSNFGATLADLPHGNGVSDNFGVEAANFVGESDGRRVGGREVATPQPATFDARRSGLSTLDPRPSIAGFAEPVDDPLLLLLAVDRLWRASRGQNSSLDDLSDDDAPDEHLNDAAFVAGPWLPFAAAIDGNFGKEMP